MRASILSLVPFVLCTVSVSASLYPTHPIAKSVLHGGTWNNLTWKDTKTSPLLSELGNLQIELWGNDKHLANLASGVDPRQMSQKVYIPAELRTDAPNFVIRFKSSDPPMTVYTANFAITDMNDNRSSHSDDKPRLPSSSASTHPLASIPTSATPSTIPTSAPIGGNNDLVTVTMEMSDSSAVPFPAATTAGTVAAMANGESNGGRRVRKANMQFNFVFVLFPALFGLALAV